MNQMETFSNIKTTKGKYCKRIFLIGCLVWKVVKWLQITIKTLTFYAAFSKSKSKEQLLKNKFLDLKLTLKRVKMTALWPNDSLTFTFYATISNSIPNLTIFVKEVFWLDAKFRKWQNALWPNESLTLTFIRHSKIAYKIEQLLKKIFLFLWSS